MTPIGLNVWFEMASLGLTVWRQFFFLILIIPKSVLLNTESMSLNDIKNATKYTHLNQMKKNDMNKEETRVIFKETAQREMQYSQHSLFNVFNKTTAMTNEHWENIEENEILYISLHFLQLQTEYAMQVCADTSQSWKNALMKKKFSYVQIQCWPK